MGWQKCSGIKRSYLATTASAGGGRLEGRVLYILKMTSSRAFQLKMLMKEQPF